MSGIPIRLTFGEMWSAVAVGTARQLGAMKADKPESCGADIRDRWGSHIEGACGEMAFARAVNRYYGAPLGTYKQGGDGVGNIQVRTRSNHDYDLIVRPGDDLDARFVLVTGLAPDFVVRGWIRGRDAQRPEWIQEHGGRPPAWFVPQGSLLPLDRLDLAG